VEDVQERFIDPFLFTRKDGASHDSICHHEMKEMAKTSMIINASFFQICIQMSYLRTKEI
jgi:hypothetical protein